MNLLALIQQRGDIMIAVSVVSILGVMVLPVPPFVLDVLLSFSISLSIVILVTGVYVRKPLDFSVFPSVLLVTTLYRLSLNIASTRLVLLRGNEGTDAAGQVIRSFGDFVVGGNYAVGFTVFLILVIINFVVITKGSGRIAEVAARFTLDAMPGKQMAIDADLNAGLINEAEARRRRMQVAQEADFYGSMDGASKFVRGDAIAGLLITAINIVGGIIIGTVQKGMPLDAAARTYTILTIGDGLVSQIPALLISTAAGIVVSRAGTETDLGREITTQVLVNPKALATTAGIMAVLGMVPGLPHLPFFLLAAASGGLAYVMTRPQEEPEQAQPAAAPSPEPTIEALIEIEPLTLEIGYGLIPLVDAATPELLNKIKAMRRQLASDLGFVVPSIHVRDNLQLRPHEYSLLVRGIEAGKGEVMMNQLLAVATGEAERLEGVPTTDPAFGLPAYWVSRQDAEKAQARGYMVVDAATVVVTHITELIKGHAWELLSRSEVQGLLDAVAKNYPKIVDELVPVHLTLGGLQRVLQNLLRERVPINDLVTVLETLLDHAPSVKDVEVLTEFARQALARSISKQYASTDGSVHALSVDPRFERALLQTVEAVGVVSPDLVTKLLRSIEAAIKTKRFQGRAPILLCSPQVRRLIRRITERVLPSLVVLSTQELSPSIRLMSTGVLTYED
jgi:flagellar biosynthesis protein FlhA